jgi:CO/xanthine dehydrogenase Mo-binding subunit
MNNVKFGQALPRVEDRKLLTGRGCYVDDIDLPMQAHGVVVYSNHARARIRSIDTSRALQSSGTLGVLTGNDIAQRGFGGLPPLFMPEDAGGPKAYRTIRPLLAQTEVRHVGDRVAFCVAETLDQARDAAELIEIDYEPLPGVSDLSGAVLAGAPSVWDAVPTNVCFTLRMGDAAACEKAFAEASHRVRLPLVNNRVTASSMEPRGAIGHYTRPTKALFFDSSTQNPHRVRETLAQSVFRIPESKLRVVGPDVGGGFGMKGDTYPEEGIVLLASQLVGRPVKWNSSRSDAFILDNAGRDQVVDAEMALDPAGRILAVRVKALHNLGAYMVGAALVPLVFSLKLIPNVYRVPAIDLCTQGVFTNTAPTNPYRGAGRPEAIYVTERLLDLAADELGIDPVEIRKRNFIDKADRSISLKDVARRAYHPAKLPKGIPLGLEARAYFAAEPPGFPNGCHICEVEIDATTGETRVDRYAAVDDFGRLINPLIVSGQVHGALAQGLGQALGEHIVYDASGQLLTASLMDYAMPRASEMPTFVLAFNEEPCRTNPLGVKGAGEAGCVAAPPVVINAMLNALHPLGIRHIDMPATSERIWQAIRVKRQ